MTNTRPLVIYHANCMDGFSAAWCFWRKYGHSADYLAAVYEDNPPDVTGRNVYLVDFSYKADVVRAILEKASRVTLIDHHKTALEDLSSLHQLNGGLGWYCDLKRSGATLAWDYLFPNEERPRLLNHIEDRDLWHFKLPNTKEISAFVFSYEFNFEEWDKLMSSNEEELSHMAAIGAVLERKHQKDIRKLLDLCQRGMTIGNHFVVVANLPKTMASDAGHLLAQGVPFAACYFDTLEYREFSLRSDKDGLDVSEIAKEFGGGGHVHAAGFKVPRDHPLASA